MAKIELINPCIKCNLKAEVVDFEPGGNASKMVHINVKKTKVCRMLFKSFSKNCGSGYANEK